MSARPGGETCHLDGERARGDGREDDLRLPVGHRLDDELVDAGCGGDAAGALVVGLEQAERVAAAGAAGDELVERRCAELDQACVLQQEGVGIRAGLVGTAAGSGDGEDGQAERLAVGGSIGVAARPRTG